MVVHQSAVLVMRSLMLCALAAASSLTMAAGRPYVDPQQLDLPWPRYSFAKQPWRAYLEVMPATTYLQGLGVVWGPPVPGRSEDQIAATLAVAGFRRVRLELPWSAMRWDEEGIVPEHAARTLRILTALRRHGLRPLILLNANHHAPCPMRVTSWRVAQPVPAGSRHIPLEGAMGLVPVGRGLVLTLAAGGLPGPLVTARDMSQGSIELSRPLARPLAAGEVLQIGELKYLPFGPVGSAQFEHSAAGWLRYVQYMTRLVAQQYGPDFDLEIWNELTFGSAFLNPAEFLEPRPAEDGVDSLRQGGRAWELARRTQDAVARSHPQVQVIWGFSNTTFFHTPVTGLPPGIAGQSYHPYGTGPRCHAQLIAGREQFNADAFVPTGCATMPEGWAHSFQQTESLMRLLQPAARSQRPPRSARFGHYITEHGLELRSIALARPDEGQRARAKFLLRAPLFWLNKGIAGLFVFRAHDPDPAGFGVLAADGGVSPALLALQRLVKLFGATQEPRMTRRMDAVVTPLGRLPPPHANDPDGRFVAPQDLVTLLPFDTGTGRLVVGMYIMSSDFPRDLAPQAFRIALDGVAGSGATVEFHDPLSGTTRPVRVVSRGTRSLTVELELTDVPRLLLVSES